MAKYYLTFDRCHLNAVSVQDSVGQFVKPLLNKENYDQKVELWATHHLTAFKKIFPF